MVINANLDEFPVLEKSLIERLLGLLGCHSEQINVVLQLELLEEPVAESCIGVVLWTLPELHVAIDLRQDGLDSSLDVHGVRGGERLPAEAGCSRLVEVRKALAQASRLCLHQDAELILRFVLVIYGERSLAKVRWGDSSLLLFCLFVHLPVLHRSRRNGWLLVLLWLVLLFIAQLESLRTTQSRHRPHAPSAH